MWWWVVAVMASEPCPATLRELTTERSGAAVIVVHKAARRLALYRDGLLAVVDGRAACWPVALAPGAAVGPKERQGDRRTPEGWYGTSDKPTSSFYHAIAVHYPNGDDVTRGREAGLIDARMASVVLAALASGRKPPQGTALGGEILIHGGGASADWTLGCVALDDADLDRLRALLPAGMAADVWIRP